MTDQEAYAEAKRRWGTSAVLSRNGDVLWVGEGGEDPTLYGTGASWEEAFKDADRRSAASPGKEK